MKKIKLLLLVLVASTTTALFSQKITTNYVFDNIGQTYQEETHHFDLSFGENNDVFWFKSIDHNEIFVRKTATDFGFTKSDEFYKMAFYLDSNNFLTLIQYFPYEDAVRVTYYDTNIVFEFFK